MKNLFSIALIALAFAVTSCSKEAKLNRKIDGEWKVVKANGVDTPAGNTTTYKFEKDKKGTGKVTYTNEYSSGSIVLQGTYTLTKDKLLAIKYNDIDKINIYNVHGYSKKSLIMTKTATSSYGYVYSILYELEKK